MTNSTNSTDYFTTDFLNSIISSLNYKFTKSNSNLNTVMTDQSARLLIING